MAMGRRKKRVRQEGLWTPTAALPVGASHPFYERLNQILDEKKFDEFVEPIREGLYAGEVGRPGLAPGIYFRLLMVGYFEGIDSERGIAWRASDSLSIRSLVRIALDESVPDHSTISRTRRLMDVETHHLRFGGTAFSSAARTVRRCTLYFWATPCSVRLAVIQGIKNLVTCKPGCNNRCQPVLRLSRMRTMVIR
jgi:hypothetical protein